MITSARRDDVRMSFCVVRRGIFQETHIFVVPYSVQKNKCIMRVISSSELRDNMKKYLDLASEEKILIQRGRNETFVLSREYYLEPDEDLARGISAKELLVGVEDDIRAAYRKKYGNKR